MGSAEAEAAEQLGPYRPKEYKQRGHDDRGIKPKPMLRCFWGCIRRMLKSSVGTRAPGSAEAEAVEQLGPYRPKAGK